MLCSQHLGVMVNTEQKSGSKQALELSSAIAKLMQRLALFGCLKPWSDKDVKAMQGPWMVEFPPSIHLWSTTPSK